MENGRASHGDVWILSHRVKESISLLKSGLPIVIRNLHLFWCFFFFSIGHLGIKWEHSL